MNLTKENVKKICGIILFTVVVLVIVQNYEKVGNAIGLLWGIIFPFVLGGIIAFILNIPMRAIEKATVQNAKSGKQNEIRKTAQYDYNFSACNRSDCGCDTYCCAANRRNCERTYKSRQKHFFLKYRNGQRICSVIIRKSTIGLQVCSSIPTNLWILR